MNEIDICCADCGSVADEGVSLKACKSCMLVKYCNAKCQRNHWPKHKKLCKRRAAELRDEALFKDPPAKEECPICFLPMSVHLICSISLPPATILSVPIHQFSIANERLPTMDMDQYYECCGKSICGGCIYSCIKSGNNGKCPFCNTEIKRNITDEVRVEKLMKRVESNDPASISILAQYYLNGEKGFQQDLTKAIELFTRAADLGSSTAHCNLADVYHKGGNMKKAKYHYEAAAMAGHEVARCNLGGLEYNSGNMERAIKHWMIAASAGEYNAMHVLRTEYEKGYVSRELINTSLIAYNNSCAEMRSEARDAYIRLHIERF
jgi:tetratricopeptide (TPR) repeat protein